MMSAVLGIFTRHVVTKFVALMLAIVLFVFTQQGISDTQLIKQVTIHFELSKAANKTWVLLKEDVVLRDMTVQGLRDTLTREIAGLRGLDFRKTLVIDEEFLRRHSTGQPIVMDAAFCETEEIPWKLDRDFRLVVHEPTTLQIARRVNRTFRPVMTEETLALLDLPENYKFRGRGGAARPTFEWVGATVIAVTGPEDALPPENEDKSTLPLYILIRPLTELLQGADTLAEARDTLPIDGIDWERSGFKSKLINHVVIERPSSSRIALRNEIWIRCDLEEQRVALSLKLSIQFLTNSESLNHTDLVGKKYSLVGKVGMWGTIFDHDENWELVEGFDLKVAQTWSKKSSELEKYLSVRIDFTNAEKRGKTIVVPVELIRIDGPTDLSDTVRIARNDSNDPPALEFQKNK